MNKSIMSNPNTTEAKSPISDTVTKWECSFCDSTATSLIDVRRYIAISDDEFHASKDGWSPEADIIGLADMGDQVKIVEVASLDNPDPPFATVSKKTEIINTRLARDPTVNAEVLADVLDPSPNYVEEALVDLEQNKIPPEKRAQHFDQGLQEYMNTQLDRHHNTTKANSP